MTPRFLSKSLAALFVVLLLLAAPATFASNKKGIGLADLHAADKLDALHVAWYYTWKPTPIENASDPQFVPMIWGGKNIERQLSKLGSAKADWLLGFNEPDNAQQSNLSVSEAISQWPQLQSHAEQIGSPAVAQLQHPWLDAFMQQAAANKLRVDFITLHLYGPPKPEWFLSRIDEIYKKYHRPIWITEFAVADWAAKGHPGKNRYSEAQVLDLMKAVLPALEKRPYVARYAWFGAGALSQHNEQVRTSRLFEPDGSLTELGRFYAQFD